MSTHAVSPLSMPILPPCRKEPDGLLRRPEASPCNRGTSRERNRVEGEAAARRDRADKNVATAHPGDGVVAVLRRADREPSEAESRRPSSGPRTGDVGAAVAAGRRTTFLSAPAIEAPRLSDRLRCPCPRRSAGAPSSAPGQAHDEAGALREPGGHVDGSTVRLDHLAHEKEPDPEVPAARRPAVGVVAAPEWVEQVRQHLGRDRLAQVVRRQRPLPLAPLANLSPARPLERPVSSRRGTPAARASCPARCT